MRKETDSYPADSRWPNLYSGQTIGHPSGNAHVQRASDLHKNDGRIAAGVRFTCQEGLMALTLLGKD